MLEPANLGHLPKRLKLKTSFISMYGGRSWLAVEQFYLTRMDTSALLDDSIQGLTFRLVEEAEEASSTPGH